MWGSSLKGSEFCMVTGGSNGFTNFRPCLDNVILPGIFVLYIFVWCLIDIGFFTAAFWRRVGSLFHGIWNKCKNIVQFFLSCCLGSCKQVPPSQWDADSDEMVPVVNEDDQRDVSADFIDPKCGNCEECLNNHFCPMKVWNELRCLRRWCRPFQIIGSIVGSVALLFDIFLVILPPNVTPNTDEGDSSLKTLIAIAPEWNIATHLAMQAAIGVMLVLLIGRQMNKVPVSLYIML